MRNGAVAQQVEAGLVQNEPVICLTGVTLALHLLTIGWTERELARRLGRSQSDVARIGQGRGALPADESAWIVHLSDFHRAHPAPRKKVPLFLHAE